MQASDVYSLALVLWEIISGMHPTVVGGKCYVFKFLYFFVMKTIGSIPFSDENKQDDIRVRVLSGDRPQLPDACIEESSSGDGNAPWQHYSAIITRSWQHYPGMRPRADEILSELECLWRGVGNRLVFDTDVSRNSFTLTDSCQAN